jgi:hypothetical protein
MWGIQPDLLPGLVVYTCNTQFSSARVWTVCLREANSEWQLGDARALTRATLDFPWSTLPAVGFWCCCAVAWCFSPAILEPQILEPQTASQATTPRTSNAPLTFLKRQFLHC